jgi:hypothetical protein
MAEVPPPGCKTRKVRGRWTVKSVTTTVTRDALALKTRVEEEDYGGWRDQLRAFLESQDAAVAVRDVARHFGWPKVRPSVLAERYPSVFVTWLQWARGGGQRKLMMIELHHTVARNQPSVVQWRATVRVPHMSHEEMARRLVAMNVSTLPKEPRCPVPCPPVE